MNEQQKKSSIIDVRSALQTIESHNGMIKLNRILLTAVVVLMFIVVAAGSLLLPKQTINLPKNTAAANTYAGESHPVLAADVNALKAQMIGLVSGSIESKLRRLEEGIRSGAATETLGTLEDLKNDVKVLRSYSKPAEANATSLANEQLMQEISQLRNLIYVSLASCGLMLAAIAGIWLKNANKLTYIKVITHYLGKH